MPSEMGRDQAPHNDRLPPEPADRGPQGGRINPDLVVSQRKKGRRPGDAYIRTHQPYRKLFRSVGGHLVATPEANVPVNRLGRSLHVIKAALIGRALFSREEIHERLTKPKALAVFGSDAISSCAYATEAALVVLVVAGNSALNTSLYISLAVALLLSVVAFSYRQIVHAYPQGGGAYNVSLQNLGRTAGLVAAAALLIDYVMTVAVSIAAGAFAVTSALAVAGTTGEASAIINPMPHFFNLNVAIGLIFILIITLGNLRGIRESGSIFAVPTYLFIFGFVALLVVGMIKASTGNLEPSEPPPVLPIAQPLTLWLVLRAFSAGAVAMSGTEAISNGVPAFKPPEARNAATTMTIMAALLAVFFVGISYLATHMGLVPGNQSIISQVALAVFGRNAFYYVFQFATMGILVVAANTAFTGFPRLSSLLAQDNYMPHSFLHRGDRLAFSTGIIFLGGLSGLLLIAFSGNVDSLIHLYAVGVFLAFSLSNTSMVIHWWRTRGPGWKASLTANAAGAVLTAGVLAVVAVTKFALGAWIVILLIPSIIPLFLVIHRHYDRVAEQLRVIPSEAPPPRISQFVLVPIDDVNYASLRAMSYARTICEDIIVLHVATDPARVDRVRRKMQALAADLRLVIVESPLRSIIPPLITYIDTLHKQYPETFVSIVLPEFITAHWWERFLHNRTAEQLTRAFKTHPNIAVILVPYQLRR